MLKIFVIPYKKEVIEAFHNKFKREMVSHIAYDDAHMVKSNLIWKST